MKKNAYEIEKNIERVLRGDYTGFLQVHVCKEICSKLKKKDYQIIYPFDDAEKVIITGGKFPLIRLFRIVCYKNDVIQHSSILGSLFGLNITSDMFGDIVFYDGNFYVYFLDEIVDLVSSEFSMVGRVRIDLEEVEYSFLENYKRNYENLELIVSSLRIDSIISRLIGCNRECAQDKIRDKLVLINGEVAEKVSYLLQEEDIFSIKGYGKYCFRRIDRRTKKNRYIAVVDKYL